MFTSRGNLIKNDDQFVHIEVACIAPNCKIVKVLNESDHELNLAPCILSILS